MSSPDPDEAILASIEAIAWERGQRVGHWPEDEQQVFREAKDLSSGWALVQRLRAKKILALARGAAEPEPGAAALNGVRQRVEEAYARTHERLKDDPRYLRLKAAADAEEASGSEVWLERNLFSLFIEQETP